ncbi:MAG: KEOPS complex subunit Cgi121 [Halobacteria archaeon]|nr:KEOPS complex subunit Cgi121 [Halobacteria archaeon]
MTGTDRTTGEGTQTQTQSETQIRVLEAETETEIDDIDGFIEEMDRIGERHGVVVQGFDVEYLASRRHVEEAVRKTQRAFERGENVARKRSMEVLLYAAGTRQIDVATEMGVKEGESTSVFVVYSESDGCRDPDEVDEAVEELSNSDFVNSDSVGRWNGDSSDPQVLREFFGIGDEEIDAVGESKLEVLVLERVALLDVNK